MPNATVTSFQTSTELSRNFQTNQPSLFPTLPGDVYKIIVSRTGFTMFTRYDLNVSPNAVARLDVALQVGVLAESINVDAAPPLLQTDRADVRAEITTQQVENAPLRPVRNYAQMFEVLPGFTCSLGAAMVLPLTHREPRSTT